MISALKLKYIIDASIIKNLQLFCFHRYEKSSRFGTVGYEDDFLRHLQNIMTDVDRRIRRGHARLNLGERKEKVQFAFDSFINFVESVSVGIELSSYVEVFHCISKYKNKSAAWNMELTWDFWGVLKLHASLGLTVYKYIYVCNQARVFDMAF